MVTTHKIVNNSCQTGLTQKGQWANFAHWPFCVDILPPILGIQVQIPYLLKSTLWIISYAISCTGFNIIMI